HGGRERPARAAFRARGQRHGAPCRRALARERAGALRQGACAQPDRPGRAARQVRRLPGRRAAVGPARRAVRAAARPRDPAAGGSPVQYLVLRPWAGTRYMAKQVYDASAIEALKGLEPVRRMPGMYTHTIHPLHIVQEAIDNAVDEALAGYGKKITLTVFKDGSVEVEDEGRGIPVDMHKGEGRPAVEVAFTMLHAGGKFSKSG